MRVSLAAVSALSKKVFPHQWCILSSNNAGFIYDSGRNDLLFKKFSQAGFVTLLLNRKTDQCTTHLPCRTELSCSVEVLLYCGGQLSVPSWPWELNCQEQFVPVRVLKTKLVWGGARQRPQWATKMNISNQSILPRGSAGSHTDARPSRWALWRYAL